MLLDLVHRPGSRADPDFERRTRTSGQEKRAHPSDVFSDISTIMIMPSIRRLQSSLSRRSRPCIRSSKQQSLYVLQHLTPSKATNADVSWWVGNLANSEVEIYVLPFRQHPCAQKLKSQLTAQTRQKKNFKVPLLFAIKRKGRLLSSKHPHVLVPYIQGTDVHNQRRESTVIACNWSEKK